MSTQIEIPIEIWMLILDHLRIDAQIVLKEKELNEKEKELEAQSRKLIDIANRLENDLTDTTILINSLNQMENNLLATMKTVDKLIVKSNIDMANEIIKTISYIDDNE